MDGGPMFALNGEQLPVVFTRHARERMKLWNLSQSRAYHMLCEAIPDRAPDRKFKEKRYHGNYGVKYLRWGNFIFTGKEMLDKMTREPIFLIITVTDQRIMLRS